MASTTGPSKITVAPPVNDTLPKLNESFDDWIDRLASKWETKQREAGRIRAD